MFYFAKIRVGLRVASCELRVGIGQWGIRDPEFKRIIIYEFKGRAIIPFMVGGLSSVV